MNRRETELVVLKIQVIFHGRSKLHWFSELKRQRIEGIGAV